jgi:hypothetical protein
MKKKKELLIMFLKIATIYIFLFLCVHIGYAENATIHDPLILIAPNSTEINHTCGNQSDIYPITCQYGNYSSSSRCDITKNLFFGETLAKDDPYCNLNIFCPDCAEAKNKTYNANFRIEKTTDSVIVTFIETNLTRIFNMTETSYVETPYEVICPMYESYQEPEDVLLPVNVTDDQFRAYCLEPFGMYGQSIRDIHDSYREEISLKDTQLGTYSASNTALSTDLATCVGDLKACSLSNTTNVEWKNKYEVLNVECQTTRDKNSELESRMGMIMLILVVIGAPALVFLVVIGLSKLWKVK